jgi:uncharacterized protein (DUF1800 family)
MVLLSVFIMTPCPAFALDSDGDGVNDTLDNCIDAANTNQRDSNGDGFGNACDADLDDSGFVNFADLSLFKSAFGSNNADADFDDSGFVNFADLSAFKVMFGKPPGPAGSGSSLSQQQAARFLTQTTFGPTLEDIDHLVSLGNFDAWLNEQFSQPATLQYPAMQSLAIKMCDLSNASAPPITGGSELARAQVWWETAVKSKDQLRQRVALALSEIMVVSAKGVLQFSQYGLADYHDVLTRNAFGNFRDLLEQVTLHPMMGRYLSMLRNEKANPQLNFHPDENYAREIMQLFTIGVHELNSDGSLVLDANSQPIPTYGQQDIEEFAKVYTGWDFANSAAWRDLYIGNGDATHPMKAWEAFHDTSEKQLLNGFVIAGGGTAKQDLDKALDHLFNHPNVGPFISKQLIQRLVTSNPSPAYVARVANVFNNNGDNTRGDLKAVIKAILLDQEARNGHLDNPQSFGKLREPMLRITHLWRAFPAIPITKQGSFYGGNTCGQGSYEYYVVPFNGGLSQFEVTLGQTMLRSPTVFNFFLPDYSPPGVVHDQNLVAPEFQIVTENTHINTFNAIIFMIRGDQRNTSIDITQELPLANSAEQLVNHLNPILLNNLMSPELRQILLAHLGQVFPDGEEGRKAKVRDTIKLIVSSPEYLIQQ